MNPKYLYLALNIGSFIVPFCFSFYPKANFSSQWRYYLPAIFLTAILFIAWDSHFTKIGVWGFNEKYVTGIQLWNLPIEEALFFFCIPYACLFTYFAFTYLIKRDYFASSQNIISLLIIIGSFVLALFFYNRAYTFTTFLFLGIFLTLMLILKVRFLGRFYFTYAIILIPFFLINGILTGSWIDEPVVWYNNEENLGLRLGTIPVEDVFYGMLMLAMPVAIQTYIRQLLMKKNSPARGLPK